MRRILWLVSTLAIVISQPVSAGIYSGPSDTTNPFDGAIAANDARFIEWANQIDATRTMFAPRGSTAINEAGGFNSLGDLDESQIANGDSPGFLTVQFAKGIGNGIGHDFAVFENGFPFGTNDAGTPGLYAEFAHVDVSTNGNDFARFPSISLNNGPLPGGFGSAFSGFDVTNVYNLAGKHSSGFGTPFDLDDLANDPLVSSGLVDLANIQYVRLFDIPGNGSFTDSQGNPVFDNWLTTGSGGFDFRLGEGLGVGVLNMTAVPEPSSFVVFCIATGAVFLKRRRKWSVSKKRAHGCLLTALAMLTLAPAKPAAAATVVDFESFSLDSSGVFNGPVDGATSMPGDFGGNDLIGEFSVGDIGLSNRFNDLFGSWSGFAISNHTDVSTAGYANQFSAFPGGGTDGSANYAVGFGHSETTPTTVDELKALPSIYLAPSTRASQTRVSNTTYSALSMQNGDSFAKQFGGASGDDPDFYTLSVYGIDQSNQVLDAVLEFDLADFRSSNNADDYILSDWATLDLTSLHDARSLHFNLSSSDVGSFGMNTPAYFALDNFETITAVPEPSGIVLIVGVAVGLAIRRRRSGNQSQALTAKPAARTPCLSASTMECG